MENEAVYHWIQKVLKNFRLRLSIVGVMIAVFIVIFPYVYSSVGPPAGALITLVVLVGSILLGIKSGLILWAITVPLFIIEVSSVGHNGFAEAMENWPGIVGTLILTIITGLFKKIVSKMWHHHQSAVANNNERLKKINSCFLTFDADPEQKIKRLTFLAGEILGAHHVLYIRVVDDRCSAIGFMGAEGIENAVIDPSSELFRILTDENSNDAVHHREPHDPLYRDAGGSLRAQHVRTYAGKAVRVDGITIGTLCVLFEDVVDLGTAEREILGILASAIGVEEKRKRVDESLRESEERLRRAEEVALTGNWKLSLADNRMHFSDGAKRIYGFPRNDASLLDVQNAVLPHYRSVLDKAYRDLVERNSPYEVEFKIHNGITDQDIAIHSKAEYDPASRTMFGVIQDITDRKRLEQQLIQS